MKHEARNHTSINVSELYTRTYEPRKTTKTKNVASLLTDPRPLTLGTREAKTSARIFTELNAQGKATDTRDALVTDTMLTNECATRS